MKRTICLIDAENYSAKKLSEVTKFIQRTDKLIEMRVYGDFSRPGLKTWKKYAISKSMVLVNEPGAVAGKNSSDISLVVDAMTLLYERRSEFDQVALITSDSDFAVLARRFRNLGVDVQGFGEAKAPESFRMACNNYWCYNEVVEENKRPHGLSGPLLKLIKLLKKAIKQNLNSDGWAMTASVNRSVRSLNPSIHHKRYGAKKFSDLFRRSDLRTMFELRRVGDSLQVKIAC
ncbi:TPA: NYN domain-containing protein [Vibrio parahaemolyticus]|nr:NYN domain-containing protein [Vibrio parahaemolyticus]